MPAPLAIPATCEELLAQMIGFDTVNGIFSGRAFPERELALHLEQLASTWGLRVRRCPVRDGVFNLLVTSEGTAGAEWLLFESHLDTVGVAGMSIAPFVATIAGGRISGRGAWDTKGSGAAMLWALRDYARGGARPRNVGVVFSVDEEERMTGAAAFARGELREFKDLRGMIVGEPTRMQPVVATNGALRWKTITHGVAAHSADPAKGRSAISAMLQVVQALEAHYIPAVTARHPLTGRAAASINIIHGGTQVNIIPDYCEIECDRRLAPGEDAAEALRLRDAVLAELCAAHPGLRVEHSEPYWVPAVTEESSQEFYAWLAPVLAGAGADHARQGAAYVTNASHYAAAGAACVVLGPGDIAQAHRKDEWLSGEQLALAARVYLALMRA